MAVIELTNETFEKEVMNQEKLVLIDFWAAWCGPCKMISPIVDNIAEEQTDIKVCKVNVDDQSQLAMRYNVMSIPTLLFIKNGEVAETVVGVQTKGALLDIITKLK